MTPNDMYLQPGSGTGPVVLHNVGAGSLASGSTDAVNGGQINSFGASLAAALGGGAAFNSTSGQITAPTYSVQGSNYSTVGGAIGAIDSGLTSIRNNMNAVNAKIEQNRDIAAAGTASALAASQIRFADRPGSQSLGIGGGLYDGQGAIAAGYGFTSADGAWRGNASVSYAPGVQKVGVGAGVSVTW